MAKLAKILTMLLVPIAAGATLLLRRTGKARSVPQGTDRGRGAPSKATSSPRLESLRRSELYDRARKLDIPRRSMMNKRELIEAIRAARG